MRLSYVDVEARKPVEVDKASVFEISQYAWSPDSKWIAFQKQAENNFPTLYLYSLESRTITQATSGLESSYEPLFDTEGRYLYFLSDRDINPALGTFELSFTVSKLTRPHAITLRAETPSPFAPESDEVKLAEEGAKPDGKGDKVSGKKPESTDKPESKEKPASKDKKEPFRIDRNGIAQRVVGFPVPPGNYFNLRAAKGKVYWLSQPVTTLTDATPPKSSLRVFDMEKRKEQQVVPDVDGFELAPDGAKILYRADKTFGLVEPKPDQKVGDGKLDLSGLQMELDPKAEWAQIFNETWRVERDFFYLPGMGAIDWPAMRRRYEPLLAHVSHRIDLNYVLGEMAGELGSGHSYVGGGDMPKPAKASVGLLGADLVADARAGLWKIGRILPGQNWREDRRSPLTEPGVKVAEGEYLLAVDGKDLSAKDEPYRLLVQTVGRTVTLLVNDKPTKAGAREITVKPIATEQGLRYLDMVETNRRKVEQATNGRVGYIHIPDMGGPGLQEFIRQYYPQLRKEGLIVDVRANGGGFVSEMILERLRRTLMGMGSVRNARSATYPTAAFNGPMVALVNMYSASDGDIFPFYFREYGLGPLIGQRSWGGVVGIRGLGGGMVDGGYTFVPEFGTYNLKSEWVIENHGVDPDIEVDNLPQDELAGRMRSSSARSRRS
jgi:tricorn protease